jgi:hypothetical protein
MESSIHNQIENAILSLKPGTIIFPQDFIDLGSSDAVKKTLSRLEKKGIILRLGRGIYLYPKKDILLGTVYPSIDSIAEAIAKRDKARIIPTGVLALQKLGLSTQVPMKVVFLTDGTARQIRLRNQTITFKKTNPKNLSIQGKLIGLIIQAMKELGKKSTTTNDLYKKIQEMLANEDPEIIQEDIKLAPIWIRKLLLPTIKKNQNDRLVSASYRTKN